MKELTVKVYELNELSEKAREKAIYEHYSFLKSTTYKNETTEDIEYRENLTINDTIENILLNEYMFFENGDLIPAKEYKNLK